MMKDAGGGKADLTLIIGRIVLAAGLVLAGVGGYTYVVSSHTPPPTSDHIYLSVAYNPYTGVDEVFPANFTIPAGVDVTVTITNYDNGTNPVYRDFTPVTGVVGGTATVNGRTASSWPADQVTHTFTVHDAYGIHLNVPIPPAQDQTPTVVVFGLHIDQPGTYYWHCMAPCDQAAMGNPGFMAGYITVV